MKNSLIALIISILFHIIILVLLLLKFQNDDNNFIPKHGTKEGERISIKQLKFPKPSSSTKIIQGAKKAPLKESIAKKEVKKEREKLSKKQEDSKKIVKKIEKKAKQPIKKQAQRQVKQQTQKQVVQAQRKAILPEKSSSPSIYDFGKKTMENQEIKELYGDEIYSMNFEERKFIENNLSSIGKITQKYLKYPRIAGRLGQEGDNIVEFYLHPNGDISDLKLITPLGYQILDDNTIRTVEIAYKDYPYPTRKTKIRIRVMYRIY